MSDKEKVKSESEKFIHITKSVVDTPDRSYSASSGTENGEISDSTIKKTERFKLRKLFHVCILFTFHFCLFTFFSSCNETFEPMQENDRYYFTIYGFLDATADTQWVRVAPARDTFDTPPEIPDINVTLEQVENGEVIIMNKSLSQMAQGFNALNVWSEAQILPGHTYRLFAKRADGASSEVTVTLPDDFPTPRFIEDRSITRPHQNRVIINGVDHIADVQTIWYVRLSAPGYEEKKIYSFSYRNTTEFTTGYGNAVIAVFSPDKELETIERQTTISSHPEGNIEILHRQVLIASAGPDWIANIDFISDIELALPEGMSNVENGLGYMVGIVSKIIPYKSCEDPPGIIVPCPVEKPFW